MSSLYYNRSRRRTRVVDPTDFGVFFVYLIIVSAALVILMGPFLSYKEDNGVFLEKWYISVTRVTYTETSFTCSDECSLETETVTRCSSSLQDNSYPFNNPEPACNPKPSDKIRHSYTCYMKWFRFEDETEVASKFDCKQWLNAEEGLAVRLTLNFFNNIIEFEMVE